MPIDIAKFWRAIQLLAAIALLACGYAAGWAHTRSHYLAREAKAAQQAQAALTAATAAAAAKERSLNQSLLTQSEQLLTVQSHADDQINQLRTAVRTGAVRLSIPVANYPACANTAITSQSGEQARAELVPAAAEDLISIAEDGDSAVRQLNAVIDAYQSIRAGCDAGQP